MWCRSAFPFIKFLRFECGLRRFAIMIRKMIYIPVVKMMLSFEYEVASLIRTVL